MTNDLDDHFAALYQQYSKKLNRIVYQMTKDAFLAEDIVQETFIKAFSKMETIIDSEKIGAWLTVIAKRTAIDCLRKEKRNSICPIEDTENFVEFLNQSIEQKAELMELIEAVHLQINGWDPDKRKVFVLKSFHGLKEEEISQQMAIKTGTIKTWIFRSRKCLKEQLKRQLN
ncbi:MULTISPECIES: RNA polymerase sigma factor [Bacillaceae]|uniref:RNA polymerase sigma factor n=1 Tax=Peribacillus huizhouensis TaxID=1501239 RepID=A0ABR6CJM5_9BACI|nr:MULTISPECIES: RNA polymerase sigma factor [Bacillaceae]MBA9024808.1 RNA polymerase sigma-70 factor (ECF subfamily) [Peribacillus huizhouensis]